MYSNFFARKLRPRRNPTTYGFQTYEDSNYVEHPCPEFETGLPRGLPDDGVVDRGDLVPSIGVWLLAGNLHGHDDGESETARIWMENQKAECRESTSRYMVEIGNGWIQHETNSPEEAAALYRMITLGTPMQTMREARVPLKIAVMLPDQAKDITAFRDGDTLIISMPYFKGWEDLDGKVWLVRHPQGPKKQRRVIWVPERM